VAEAAQQNIGKGGGKLSVRRREDLSAMDEMKIEAAHRGQGQEMVVPPLLRRGGVDPDLLRPGTPAGEELARPSQRFEGLVPRAGARLRTDFGVFLRRPYNRNAELVNPWRNVSRACDPLDLRFARERGDKGSPYRGHLGSPVDYDSAEQCPRIRSALKRGADKIRRPAHRGR
jgi:hypothetical protein